MSTAVPTKSKNSQIINERAKVRITEDSILSGIIEKVSQQVVLKQLFLVYQTQFLTVWFIISYLRKFGKNLFFT